MKYIKTDFSIPYYNMALEEYLLTSEKFRSEEYMFFYIHSPSVIIGKYQNAYAEINMQYARENNIIIARRLSGGGSVYHDEGNLNFSFVLNKAAGESIDFKKYTLPVVNALYELGLDVSLSGRNDILLGGRKISGNAQHASRDKLLHHGTLLFDTDIEKMLSVLNVSALKISTKAIKSVRSRVCNIKEYLGENWSVQRLRDYLCDYLLKENEKNDLVYELDEEDIAQIRLKVSEKFGTESYNLGKNEHFTIENEKKFPSGIVKIGIELNGNVIEKASVTGDFFAFGDVERLEGAMIGVIYEPERVLSAIKAAGCDDTIAGVGAEKLVSVMFEAQ